MIPFSKTIVTSSQTKTQIDNYMVPISFFEFLNEPNAQDRVLQTLKRNHIHLFIIPKNLSKHILKHHKNHQIIKRLLCILQKYNITLRSIKCDSILLKIHPSPLWNVKPDTIMILLSGVLITLTILGTFYLSKDIRTIQKQVHSIQKSVSSITIHSNKKQRVGTTESNRLINHLFFIIDWPLFYNYIHIDQNNFQIKGTTAFKNQITPTVLNSLDKHFDFLFQSIQWATSNHVNSFEAIWIKK